jgi:hypothetical protein
MRMWRSGIAPACQAGERGFDPRYPLGSGECEVKSEAAASSLREHTKRGRRGPPSSDVPVA